MRVFRYCVLIKYWSGLIKECGWPRDWTRNQWITVAQLCTGHSPLLAAVCTVLDDGTTWHCIEPIKWQNIWSYTAQCMTRLCGSRGPTSTTKAIRDTCGASWRGSVPPTGNEREREEFVTGLLKALSVVSKCTSHSSFVIENLELQWYVLAFEIQ